MYIKSIGPFYLLCGGMRHCVLGEESIRHKPKFFLVSPAHTHTHGDFSYQHPVATSAPTIKKSTQIINKTALRIPTTPSPYTSPHAMADAAEKKKKDEEVSVLSMERGFPLTAQ
jgi:hypothetical protein